MRMLGIDCAGRRLNPHQAFFLAVRNDGRARWAKNLRAEIDPEKIEAFGGAMSLPFPFEKEQQAAVRIIDARGVESPQILRGE